MECIYKNTNCLSFLIFHLGKLITKLIHLIVRQSHYSFAPNFNYITENIIVKIVQNVLKLQYLKVTVDIIK